MTAVVAVLLLLAAGAAPGGHQPCADPAAFQAEVLEVLRQALPGKTFTAGDEPTFLRFGAAELGLGNLRGKICGATPALDRAARAREVEAHFRAMVAIVEKQEEPPRDWAAAKRAIRLQLVPVEYVADKSKLVSRPLVPGVAVTVVVDHGQGYQVVREEDRARWRVAKDELFQQARANLDAATSASKLQGNGAPGRRFLAVEERDGYDAAKLLLPWVRAEAAKLLGDPFHVAIANRDFLIMWSRDNEAGFQQFAREQARKGFEAEGYPLTPEVLLVWADGRIEVAK